MFVGFTPWVPDSREPFLNPKYAKIFKLVGAGFGGKGREFAQLEGRTIIDGFRRLGYAAIGSGAVGWFDPDTPAGRFLSADFETFYYQRSKRLRDQLAFLEDQLTKLDGRPVFLFLNVGETHVPYHHEGADWEPEPSPCRPFEDDNDAEECRRRQRACLEFVDRELRALLERFAGANVVVCADHGDAWGEDGVWEHGVPHPKVLEVPFLFRLQHPPRR